MRARMVLLGGLGVVVLLAVAAAVAIAMLDFGRFKGPLAAQVERATGRALVFEGEVSLRVFPRPSLRLRDVALANAEWGSRPHMLRIGSLDAELELGPLLFERRLHVVRLVARDADLLLETDDQGRRNWVLGEGVAAPLEGQDAPREAGGVRTDAAALPLIESMTLANVALNWRDARDGGETRSVLVRELRLTARPDGRMAVAGGLVHREQAVEFAGDIDLPSGFVAPGGPFVGQMALTLPGTVVKLVGGLANARAGAGLDVSVSAEAEPVNALDELLGVALPAVRFELSARVQGDLGGAMRAEAVKLRLGRSDLAGSGMLDLSGARPRVGAELESARLDLVEAWPDQGGGGAVPGSADGAAAPATADAAGERRVFGAEAFDFAALRRVDGDVSLRVGVLATRGVELAAVSLRLVLEDGDLAVRPFGFTVAGSHVAGDARVNAAASPPAMVLDVAAQQMDVPRLLALAGVSVPVEAKGDVVLALRGQGESPRAVAASLAGNASLVVGQGVLKGEYVESLGLGGLRAAVPQLQRLAESRLNCAIARFDIARGVATARLIAADAGDLSLVGTGTVNLGTETLALDLAPRVKIAAGGFSGGVVVPVQVRGTLLEPKVAVLGGRGGARGNPLAALGTIVLDPGASRTNPCGGLGEARPASPSPAPAPRPGLPQGVPGLPDVLRLLPR